MLVKMVVEYCQCVTDIPTAAPDLLTRLVDLLKVSGTCSAQCCNPTMVSEVYAHCSVNWWMSQSMTQLCNSSKQLISQQGWEYSGYSQISGVKFLSKSNKNGVEIHFECDCSPFRIQTVTCPTH